MALYARVWIDGPDTGTIIELQNWSDTPPNITRKGCAWLPVEITNPSFDPALQVKAGPVDTVLADKVSRVWTVRDKTAPELDADKDAIITAADRLQFLVAFNHENRVRVLEGKAAITLAQFRAALKALL